MHVLEGRGGSLPSPRFFFNCNKRILSGHLSISVAVCLSLAHCEFVKNRHIDVRDIE